MANATVTNLGQADLAGATDALFYKIFTGEVLTAFEKVVILRDKQRVRTIASGKSAGFGATYNAGTAYHTPGAEIVGTPIALNEVVITVDDLLYSDTFIAEIDEAKNHYDVRGPFSTAIGRALATQYDCNVGRSIIAAARGAALFTGDVGGQSVIDSDGRTNAASLAASIIAAKQLMEEADVPADSTTVWAAFKPAQWYLLSQEPTLILNSLVKGDGNYAAGTFDMIGGVKVVKSNALRWGVNDSGLATGPAKYKVNMTNTIGTVWVDEAVGTVQLRGIATESERDARRQGTLMIGKYIVGHGPLRNKCAVELKTA